MPFTYPHLLSGEVTGDLDSPARNPAHAAISVECAARSARHIVVGDFRRNVHAHLHTENGGLMERSKRRRKQRARELAHWEAALRGALSETRFEKGMADDQEIEDDLLIAEVLRLAHPDAVPGRDAVIPAPRLDLACLWYRARLERQADTEAERVALARRIAPPPDAQPHGLLPWGTTATSSSAP